MGILKTVIIIILLRRTEMANETGPGAHPSGALALMLVYGLMMLVLWLIIYFGIFLAR